MNTKNTTKVNPVIAFIGGLLGFEPKQVTVATSKGLAAASDAVTADPVVVVEPKVEAPAPVLRPLAGNTAGSRQVDAFTIEIRGTEVKTNEAKASRSVGLRYGALINDSDKGFYRIGAAPHAGNGDLDFTWNQGAMGGLFPVKLEAYVPKALWEAVVAEVKLKKEERAQLVLWVTPMESKTKEGGERLVEANSGPGRAKAFVLYRAERVLHWEVITSSDPRYIPFVGNDGMDEALELAMRAAPKLDPKVTRDPEAVIEATTKALMAYLTPAKPVVEKPKTPKATKKQANKPASKAYTPDYPSDDELGAAD